MEIRKTVFPMSLVVPSFWIIYGLLWSLPLTLNGEILRLDPLVQEPYPDDFFEGFFGLKKRSVWDDGSVDELKYTVPAKEKDGGEIVNHPFNPWN